MRDGYTVGIERGDINYPALLPLYQAHYRQMQERLAADGIEIPDYAPRLDIYFAAFQAGSLVNYVARFNREPVGYANVWLTFDMHNGDPIAREDVLYVTPEHRNGLGKEIVRFVLDDLRERGIRRVLISPVTDLRVGKIWKRMGFREVAMQMAYTF